MTQSEKISQLEKAVDFLRLYIEILSSKQSAINYSILDTLEKKYPEIYSEFYSKYVDALELSFNDKMEISCSICLIHLYLNSNPKWLKNWRAWRNQIPIINPKFREIIIGKLSSPNVSQFTIMYTGFSFTFALHNL